MLYDKKYSGPHRNGRDTAMVDLSGCLISNLYNIELSTQQSLKFLTEKKIFL